MRRLSDKYYGQVPEWGKGKEVRQEVMRCGKKCKSVSYLHTFIHILTLITAKIDNASSGCQRNITKPS